MKKILILATLMFCVAAIPGEVFKIEIGSNYEGYSNKELKRRLWRLEKAVWQLQQKVFHLQHTKSKPQANSWICTLEAMGDSFSASGPTKAVAKNKVLKQCKRKRGDGFFCKNPKCEQ